MFQTEQEKCLSQLNSSEVRFKKAAVDASYIADELRNEQKYAAKSRKIHKLQIIELQSRLEESEKISLPGCYEDAKNLQKRVKISSKLRLYIYDKLFIHTCLFTYTYLYLYYQLYLYLFIPIYSYSNIYSLPVL